MSLLRDQEMARDVIRVGGAVQPSRMTSRDVRTSSADDREDVARAEDEELVAAVLDLGAAVLAVDDLVTDLDVERDAVAVVVDATGADRQDLTLLGLLLGGVRDDQAGGGGLLSLDLLDDDAVLERLDVDRHGVDLPFTLRWANLWTSSPAWLQRRRGGRRGLQAVGTLTSRVPSQTLALGTTEC